MTTARDLFVNDYTLVVDNTAPGYFGHIHTARQMSTQALADKLRDDFENLISLVADAAREKGLTIGADLVSQMLIGYGADTFHDIARHYKELAENEAK
jgi:hypothetical protein